MSLFKTVLVLLGVLLVSYQASAQVMGYYHTDKPKTDEVVEVSQVETPEDTGIDFKEWDKDFDKSLNKTDQCTGKNCKFKSRQALDSSFDF